MTNRSTASKITLAARRFGVSAANFVLNRGPLLSLVGRLNRRFGFIRSVFVAYPATSEYAAHFFSEKMMDRARWNPVLCGLLRQNGRFIVGTGITSTERDLRRRGNESQLPILVENAQRLARRLGVDQVTYSGVLPGLMARRGIIADPVEADVTAAVLSRAVLDVDDECSSSPSPVIVLGARGFVGTAACAALEASGRDVYGVDLGDPWPDHLTGSEAILLNVSNRRALRKYMGRLWPGLIVLNEVYPEPTHKELEELDALGVPVHHVVGVEATALPRMPKAYKGGIPCCAAWLSPDLTPIVRQLSAADTPLAA